MQNEKDGQPEKAKKENGNTSAPPVSFVWLKSPKGPVPEKWFQKPTTGTGQDQKITPLQSIELNNIEMNWPLDALALKYPYKRTK